MKKWLISAFVALLLPTYSFAHISCTEGIDYGGDAGKEQTIQSAYEDVQDPKNMVMQCFGTLMSFDPEAVFNTCGCKQAIEELCEFDKKKGKMKGPPGCEGFISIFD